MESAGRWMNGGKWSMLVAKQDAMLSETLTECFTI